MAQRRMFSLKIVDTDAFMDMPQSSQLLYFHLSMRADDDGFVSNPKKIMRMIGSQEDDLKVLFTKKFLIPFESGVCVIKHWKIHNYIQSDRYFPTTYTDEKNQLETKENGSYKLIKDECIQNVSKMDTQVRLGKVREELGKSKDIDKYIYGEFENVKLKKEEHSKLIERFGENNTSILIEELSRYLASKKKHYSSHYATLLNWASRKIEKLQTKKRTIV